MPGARSLARPTLIAFVCYVTSALAGKLPRQAPRQDGSWTNYYNRQASYCVDYPSRWTTGDAFEGAGFFLTPGAKFLTEIDVAALPDQGAGLTLSDEAETHLDSLRKFELAEKVLILERRDTTLFGSPALFTKYSYYDPQNKTTMAGEIILSVHAGKLYWLELATRAGEDQDRFDLVFQRLAGSFRFECPPHALPRGFASSRHADRSPSPITRPVIAMPRAMGN